MTLARFSIRDRWRDWGTALIGAGLLGLACWTTWEFLPRGGAPKMVTATVRGMRQTWQAESKYRLVRLPLAELDIALPHGRIRRVEGDVGLLSQCRRGGPIKLEAWKNNGGELQFDLAAKPCD